MKTVIYIKNTAIKNTIFKFKWTDFYLNIFSNVIYSCDGKTKFLAFITQVSHDLSKILLTC